MRNEQINNMLNKLRNIERILTDATNLETLPPHFFEKTEGEILKFLKEFYILKELTTKKDHLKYDEQNQIPAPTIITPEKNESVDKAIKQEIIVEERKTTNLPDIRSFISINDKYRFLRELFDQDKNKMTQVIDILNKHEKISESIIYIAETLGWDIEESIVAEFLALVEKRFI